MQALKVFSIGFAGILALSATACGGDGSGSGGSTSTAGSGGTGGSTATGGTGGAGGTTSTTLVGGAGGAFVITLTSPQLTEGAMFAVDNTCDGLNISPELDWTAGPGETQSYSVILKDQSNNLVHSAIWDIPKEALMLPADVDKDQNPADVPGAKQAKAYDSLTYGYLGPCPGGATHTYKFTLYALNVATLPIVGVPAKESVEDLSLEHALATATLSGQSNAGAP